MMGMFDSLLDLACDTAKIATATVKLVAEVVTDLAEDIKGVVR